MKKDIYVCKKHVIIFLLKLLLLVIIFYNFHRYLFKYGSADFVNSRTETDYVEPPLFWQIGKYIIVGLIMGSIYLLGNHKKKISKIGLLFYAFIIFFLIINIFSGLYYHRILHNSLEIVKYQPFDFDELEYIVFSFLLLPILSLDNSYLLPIRENIDSILKFVTTITIISNIFVVTNYYLFDVLPFHGFKGSLLIRFGGFWDDPNGFSILCSFLLFYSIQKKRVISSIFLFINIILAISFTGYILFFAISLYFMFRNKKMLVLGFIILCIIISVALINMELLENIYELKKGSLDSHATGLFDITFIPLLQPLLFHETWLLSLNINYPPISYIASFFMLKFFFKFYFIDTFTVQKAFYIIFFISSASLPFVYMFPLNFVAILFFMLYCKKITF